mgnify:FL=1
MSAPTNVRVRFVKVWGHPTRDLIMGVGDIALVSEWIARVLIKGGYAERVTEKERETAA